MKKNRTLYRSCVTWPEADLDALIDMQDNARQVSYDTLKRNIDADALRDFEDAKGYVRGSRRGLKLKDDRCVGFYSAKLGSERVYYIEHSRIEYVFR